MKHVSILLLCLSLSLLAQQEDSWRASTLRPGDVLSISVFRVNEFSKVVRIEEDGTFAYPLCGVIQADGKTAREIGDELEKKLAPQITEPHVDVFVQTWGPRRIYILGQVHNSMSMELPTYGRMTALQAISAAGGFTESADLNNVAVLRRDSNNPTKLTRHKIDVSALVSRKDGGDDFKLLPEDTLIIPKAPPVYISGEIANPMTIFIDTQRPPLVSELVIRAGGLRSEADATNIVIVRPDESTGKNSLLPVSLRAETLGIYEHDSRVQPGDSILVGTAEKIYVLGQVRKPGPLTIAPNKTVTASQAIALSGGFLATAKQNDITLIRGTEIRSINLKKLYSSAESMKRDEILHHGDILFIQESIW